MVYIYKNAFRYRGGKSFLVSKILPLIPKHHVYVEPFGGAMNILLNKEPSEVEVYNDIDSKLVIFFRVLRDEEKSQKLLKLLKLTPYSREEFFYCRDTIDEGDDVTKAWKFYVVAQQGFSGMITKGGWSISRSRDVARTWANKIDKLEDIIRRLRTVQIENKDFRDIFKLYDTEDTFFYCDPPYVLETRGTQSIYDYEMSLQDHRDLVDILLNIKGTAILSGYYHKVYEPLELNGWKRIDIRISNMAVGRTTVLGLLGIGAVKEQNKIKTECLWLHPKITQNGGFLDR